MSLHRRTDNNVTTNTWDGNRLMWVVVKDTNAVVIRSKAYTDDANGNLATETDATDNVTTMSQRLNGVTASSPNSSAS